MAIQIALTGLIISIVTLIYKIYRDRQDKIYFEYRGDGLYWEKGKIE